MSIDMSSNVLDLNIMVSLTLKRVNLINHALPLWCTHAMDMHMQTHTSLNQMDFRMECCRVNSYLNSRS